MNRKNFHSLSVATACILIFGCAATPLSEPHSRKALAPANESALSPKKDLFLTDPEVKAAVDSIATTQRIPRMNVSLYDFVQSMGLGESIVANPGTTIPPIAHAFYRDKFKLACEKEGCFARTGWTLLDLGESLSRMGLRVPFTIGRVYKDYPIGPQVDGVWFYHVAPTIRVGTDGPLVVLDDKERKPESPDEWVGKSSPRWWQTGPNTEWNDDQGLPVPMATEHVVRRLLHVNQGYLEDLQGGPLLEDRDMARAIPDRSLRKKVEGEIAAVRKSETKKAKEAVKMLTAARAQMRSYPALPDGAPIIEWTHAPDGSGWVARHAEGESPSLMRRTYSGAAGVSPIATEALSLEVRPIPTSPPIAPLIMRRSATVAPPVTGGGAGAGAGAGAGQRTRVIR